MNWYEMMLVSVDRNKQTSLRVYFSDRELAQSTDHILKLGATGIHRTQLSKPLLPLPF